MVESLQNVTVGQLAGGATIIAAGLATIIQISPIKVDPWSALARTIGRAINKEVIEKVDKLEEDVQEIKKNAQKSDEKADERDAKAARARILRFGDEIVHEVRHSQEHFVDILDDMTAYDNYCAAHPDFKNNRTKATSQLITDTYYKCLKEHDFA